MVSLATSSHVSGQPPLSTLIQHHCIHRLFTSHLNLIIYITRSQYWLWYTVACTCYRVCELKSVVVSAWTYESFSLLQTTLVFTTCEFLGWGVGLVLSYTWCSWLLGAIQSLGYMVWVMFSLFWTIRWQCIKNKSSYFGLPTSKYVFCCCRMTHLKMSLLFYVHYNWWKLARTPSFVTA